MIEEKSLDIFAEKLAKLRELFPEVLSEGKIDFKRLQSVLGEEVLFHKEHYELSWAGKSDARTQIQKATSATLIPTDTVGTADGNNIFIEGENLEVLHVLQRAYFGKIKMIYIDPPYNTGNDSFVYPDDYSERQDEYKKRAGIIDENGFLNKQDCWKKNSKENGQFHSVWLSMMYPRLYLARNLLREDGVIFISIDDNEQANLKLLCDEIFGAENFIACLVWEKKKKGTFLSNTVTSIKEYVLAYSKNKIIFQGLIGEINHAEETYPCINASNKSGIRIIPAGIPSNFREENHFLPKGSIISVSTMELILHSDLVIKNSVLAQDLIIEGHWRYQQDLMTEYALNNELYITQDLYLRRIVKEPRHKTLKDLLPRVGTDENSTYKTLNINNLFADGWGSNEDGEEELRQLLENKAVLDFPKPKKLIEKLIVSIRDSDAIILDFFAGSGTTAHAVLDLNEQDGGNRQFICVQMPEVLDETSEAYKAGYRTIADICKTRISKVVEKIQTERDSQKQSDLIPAESKQVLGFKSFKLAPSNFKQWRSDVDEADILAQLELFKDSEQPHSENDAMLVELLLKAGLPLTTKVEIHTVAGQAIYSVQSGKLLFFFDDYNESVKAFIFTLKPKRVVCLNRVFKNDDPALTNFQLGLKDAGCELQII